MNKTKRLELLLRVAFLYIVWLCSFSFGQMKQNNNPVLGQDAIYTHKERLVTCDRTANTKAIGFFIS